MEYVDYDSLDVSELELIGSGSCADVYKLDDLAVKVYNTTSYSCCNIDVDIFEGLRDIKLPGFIDLVDYSTVTCRKDNSYSKKKSFNVEEKEVINAYSSKLINKSNEKMIDKPIDYTLETLYEFKRVVEELNKRNILISDSHEENVIVSDSNLVIIDPDLYRHHDSPDKMNLKRIKEYISSLWISEYGANNINNVSYIPDYFAGSDLDTCIENIKVRAKVKTPRELIDQDYYKLGL